MGAVLAETQKLKDVADEFEKVGGGARLSRQAFVG